MAKTLKGKFHTWQLSDDPIGSGDAGEVYAASSMEQPDLLGMLKKPAHIATGGTIQRQAGQIAQESRALTSLDGLPRGKAHPPKLLDEAPSYTHGTGQYFIVSEKAPGADLLAILSELRQAGKPFPTRIIIKVLDALFDLFSRAHKVGVLWNDVKLDHIFWNNASEDIMVIDWGNAQFLENESDGKQNALSRWEDYKQLIDTLGGFLRQNCPDLYQDLGWDEFIGKPLDSPIISILARRIAYQQQVISLRVMEYQSLIKLIVASEPSIIGFQSLQKYQKLLEKIGAPWHQAEVEAYGRSLVEESLSAGELQSTVRAVTLIWEVFGDSLDVRWHLVKEYFRQADILSHPELKPLVRNTFQENWTEALWHLIIIARESQQPSWWGSIMPVLRQKALGTNSPRPYRACQQIFRWYQQGHSNPEKSGELDTILRNWREKGEDLSESPFDYSLIQNIKDQPELPLELRSSLKGAFSPGQAAISELSQAWSAPDFEKMDQAFRQVATWDPDRWSIITAASMVDAFRGWIQILQKGPDRIREKLHFLQTHLEKRPEVEKILGMPTWLKSLLFMLNAVLDGGPTTSNRAGNWLPWLNENFEDEIKPVHEMPEKAGSITETLEHFGQHLKTWTNLEAALVGVKEQAPNDSLLCEQIVEGFQRVLALHFDLTDHHHDLAATPPQHPLFQSVQVLQGLEDWRNAVEHDKLQESLNVLTNPTTTGWRVAEHCAAITEKWLNTVLPSLKFLAGNIFEIDLITQTDINPALANAASHWRDLQQNWEKILHSGIHQPLLESIEKLSTTARSEFLNWRQMVEQGQDSVELIFYQSQRVLIRKISDRLMLMIQHIRQVKQDNSLIEKGLQQTYTSKMNTMESMLEHLGAVETLLVKTPECYPGWIKEFRKIAEATSPEERQQVVLSLSDSHPLYTTLIQTVFSN